MSRIAGDGLRIGSGKPAQFPITVKEVLAIDMRGV
jgi:hypothetical protein